MPNRTSRGSIVRIMSWYAVFGALWVAVSDHILEVLIADPHRITVLQTYKGWLFVALSALFIAFLVGRELRVRARTEQELAASEERYRTLLDAANDAVIVADAATGVILDANRKASELTGVPRSSLLGMRQFDLHPAEDRGRCRELFEHVAGGGRIEPARCFSRSGGGSVPVDISAAMVELGGKKVVLSIYRDISEHVAAEERLKRERERAGMYLDIAGVILVVIGEDEAVKLINRKGADILGLAEQEISGRSWFDAFVPGPARPAARASFRALLAGGPGAPEGAEYAVLAKGGAERTVAWQFAPVRDETGRITAVLGSGEDITERRRAEEQATCRLDDLATLHAIDLMITSTRDLHLILRQFLDLVVARFRVDAADVLLVNRHTPVLEYAAETGFRSHGIRRSSLRIGEGIAGIAALERRVISVPDLRDPASGFLRTNLIQGEDFVAYYAVPLTAGGVVKGVLELLHRSPLALDREQQDFLGSLASQAAIAIESASLFDELQRSNIELKLAYDATLEGWARALDLRDRVTERHTERVAEMTVNIARAMGLREEEIVHIRRGALLHDIGKIGIPDGILGKEGPLTEEERAVMQQHPVHAFEMLQPIAYLRPALDIPYCHHERWDGTGYPRRLKGEQIPLAARIFALADVWDAIFSADRPYRRPLSRSEACEHIRGLSGNHLDPHVVEAFLTMQDQVCPVLPVAGGRKDHAS
jgi:PAS domain S-box-containing protein/putative nucleotidyltransferase with HDIG domain